MRQSGPGSPALKLGREICLMRLQRETTTDNTVRATRMNLEAQAKVHPNSEMPSFLCLPLNIVPKGCNLRSDFI